MFVDDLGCLTEFYEVSARLWGSPENQVGTRRAACDRKGPFNLMYQLVTMEVFCQTFLECPLHFAWDGEGFSKNKTVYQPGTLLSGRS